MKTTKIISKLGFALIIFMVTFYCSTLKAQEQTIQENISQINELARVYLSENVGINMLNSSGDGVLYIYTENEEDDAEIYFNLKNDFWLEDIEFVETHDGSLIQLHPKNKLKRIRNNQTTYTSETLEIDIKVDKNRSAFYHSRILALAEKLGTESNSSTQSSSKYNLTREETVAYLDKKIKEIYENHRTVLTTDYEQKIKFYYIGVPTISMSGDRLSIFTHRANNYQKIYPENEKLYIGDFSHQFVYKQTIDCNYSEELYFGEFNPAHIISIEKGKNFIHGETVGMIEIKLKSKTGKTDKELYGPKQYITTINGDRCFDFGKADINFREITDVIYLAYLQEDDTNFTKIKNALEHLKSLFKEQDDPFAD